MRRLLLIFLCACASDPAVKEPKYKNLSELAVKASLENGQDPEKILEQVSVLPSDSDPITDEPLYRVTLVEKGSIFESRGIKAGDIVSLGTAPTKMVKQRSSGEFPVCQLQKLNLSAVNNEKDIEVGRFRVQFAGADRDGETIFETASVYRGKKKICDVEGGLFSGAYSVGHKTRIILEEHKGNCGSHRVFDVETCRTVGDPARYCGVGSVVGQQLVNTPNCSDDLCERGKVWDLSDGCGFKFNEEASGVLTRKILGVDLPAKGRSPVKARP